MLYFFNYSIILIIFGIAFPLKILKMKEKASIPIENTFKDLLSNSFI